MDMHPAPFFWGVPYLLITFNQYLTRQTVCSIGMLIWGSPTDLLVCIWQPGLLLSYSCPSFTNCVSRTDVRKFHNISLTKICELPRVKRSAEVFQKFCKLAEKGVHQKYVMHHKDDIYGKYIHLSILLLFLFSITLMNKI